MYNAPTFQVGLFQLEPEISLNNIAISYNGLLCQTLDLNINVRIVISQLFIGVIG